MKLSKNLLTRPALAAAIAVLTPVGAAHAQEASSAATERKMSESEIRAFYDRYIAALNAHEFDRMPEFIADTVSLNGNPGTRADVMAVLKGDAVRHSRSQARRMPDLHRYGNPPLWL